MQQSSYSMRSKIIAWILSICLVITLIPDIGFATENASADDAAAAGSVSLSAEEQADDPAMADLSEAKVVERTENTTTYDVGDGMKTVVLHGGEVRFENKEGELVDYDPSLIEVKDGSKTDSGGSLKGYRYENKEGDKKQYLPEVLSEDTPVLMEYKGFKVSLIPTEDTIAALGLDENKATVQEDIVPSIYEGEGESLPVNAVYGNDEDEAMLTYTSGDAGIKETLTLNEKPETNVFTYKIDVGALKIKENIADEGITIIDPETDDIIAGIEAPWMNDATGEAYSTDITYDLEETEEEGTYLLTMTIDEDYLSDEDRSYPVTVDPTVTWKGNDMIRDTYVIYGSGYADTNFYDTSITKMPVGTNSTGRHRSLFKIYNLKSEIEGKSVASAKLTLYESGTGAGGQLIRANRLIEDWLPSTVTWNNQPEWNTAAYTDQVTTSGVKNTAKVFDCTAFAKNVSRGTSNFGLILRNMTTDPSCATFWGSRYATTAYRPKLVVTYYDLPETCTSSSTSRKFINLGFVETSYFKPGSVMFKSWTGASAYKIDAIQYKFTGYTSNDTVPTDAGGTGVDLTKYRSIGKAAKSAKNVLVPYAKYLPEGKYKMWMRTKDAAGYVSSGKYRVIYVDGTAPTLSDVTVSPAGTSSSYAADLTPTVSWDASDTYFSKVTVSVDDGAEKEVTASSGAKSYTIPEGVITKSGKHTITVTAHDKSRNKTKETIDYYVDVDAPTGGIDPKAQATGESTDILKGTPLIAVTAEDEGSGIKACNLHIYKTEKNEDTGEFELDESSKVTIRSAFTESFVAELDTVEKCPENGTYRLILELEDNSGRTSTVNKDVTVNNTFPKPKASADVTGGTETTLSWAFPTGTDLTKVEYMFEGAASWTAITPESGAISGESEITVPEAEGEHTLYVRGISSTGIDSTVREVTCIVDKTAPTVDITGYNKGYLEGTVSDAHFDKWSLYVKEKSAASYSSEPYKEGTGTTEDGRIAFIGFDDSVFTAGQTYTFKLIATDQAGNDIDETIDITAPASGSIVTKIAPELTIQRAEQQERGTRKFVVKSSQKTLALEESVSNAVWYINNTKADNSFVKSDGSLEYTEGVYHDVLVINDTSGGERQYNVPVISNVKEAVSMSDGTVSGSTVTKEIQLTDDAVSIMISGNTTGATYRIKAAGGNFVQIQPGTAVNVTDLNSNIAYADTFQIEVTVPSGTTPTSVTEDIYYDYILNESFMISELENYAPEEFSAVDKINYKTYLSWDIPSDLPENITYEVYRGEESGFKPGSENLAASGIREGYFAEINIQYSSDFYYRVCAVETDANGNVINRSSYSSEAGSSVIDENEYAKYLGMKDYWEFTEFETANGNGYIEKSRGNFVYVQQDAQIPNEGLEVYLARTYNSQSSSQGAFGYGWSHDYDMELLNICEGDSLEFNNIAFKDGDGTIFLFSRNDETEDYKSSLGSYINLETETEDKTKSVEVSGDGAAEDAVITYRFIMSTKDGVAYYFNSGGQLVYMEEANGNFLIFEHASNKGLLTRMVTNNDLAIGFTYQTEEEGDPLLVKEISMPDGSKVSYEYSNPAFGAQDLLTKVTATAGDKSISYEYSYSGMVLENTEKNLTQIKDATGNNIYTLDYSDDRVAEAKYPNDEKLTFSYADDNTSTVTKKYSEGTAVLGEKDYFEGSTGRCIKSVRGVEEPDALDTSTEAEEEANYDVTKYTYVDGLLSSTETVEEYNIVDSDGLITTSTDVKTEKVGYEGDDPVKETESDGTVSTYTYYPEDAAEGSAGLVKTAKETDAKGNVVSNVHYTYDSYGNVTSEIDYAVGTKEVLTYIEDGDFKGELATEKEYLIEASGTTISSEVLQSTTVYGYVYAADGQTKTETVTQTVPKSDGTNETVTVTTVYDRMGRELSETDSRGYVATNTFDGFGRVTSTDYRYNGASSAAKTTSTTYDDNGLVTYEKLEDGIEKWYTYDNMQRVISTTVKKGDIQQTIYTEYSYENISVYPGKGADPVSVKNAYKAESTLDGTVISATYVDNLGRTVRSYENGLYTDMTYNRQGDMLTKWNMGTSVSATEGILEVYVYDKQGNLTHTITDPDYVAGKGYMIREETDSEPGSIVSESRFDDAGNVISSIDPLGNQVDYSYDEAGDLLSATVPYKAVDTGNIDSETAAEDSETTTADTVEQTEKVTYEYQYDVEGENATTQDIVMAPFVDSSGNVVTTKSLVVKDSADRTVKVTDFGTSESDSTSISTEYEYDSRDNLIRSTDSKGNYKKYSYDTRDRVTAIEYYNSSDTRRLKTAFSYDDSDNMLSMADYECSGDTETLYRYTDYDYDDMNRLIGVAEIDTETVPTESEIAEKKIGYSYDVKDNLTKITYPDNSFGVSSLEFEYDSNNWLTKVTANETKTVREYSYDDFGRTSVITDYTDFLNGTSKWMKRTYSYDSFHRPVSIEYTDNMSGSDSDIKEGHYYTYDSGSNITSERTVNSYGTSNSAAYEQLREYTYNAAGQLIATDLTEKDSEGTVTKEKKYSYDYDAAGNRTKERTVTAQEGTDKVEDTVFTYTEFNQLKTAVTTDETGATTADKAFTYDSNGNQTKEVDSVSSTTTEFTYDADNRLKTAKETAGTTVEFTQTNRYNGFGQRVQKSETVSGATDTINYFYDGTSVLYTTDARSEMTALNLIGAEDNILATARTDGSTDDFYVYTKDLRESTINMVGSDGTAPVSYNYTDYGETEILGDHDFYNEVCYGAGIYDKTTGLYYLNARYYSPENGAFLTQDTYRGERSRTATLNYYSYCAGNPINYTDPSGHAIWGILGAAMGAYDGYKYAKKKKLKGWKKAAAIVGGAALGAVNPFKVVKAAKKVYNAAKYAKKARSTYKKAKSIVKAAKKPKVSKVKVKKYNVKKGKPTKKKKYKKTKAMKAKKAKGACFVAGTKILTEKGFTPIEKIKPGDYVWSENPETNQKAMKKVNKIFVREKDSIIRLSINGEVIETTHEHPFYVEGEGFISAGSLENGDEVRLQSGKTSTIDSIEELQLEEPIKVYNFEVEDFHTYYVSEQQVLVHNTCAHKDTTTYKSSTLKSTKTKSNKKTDIETVDLYRAVSPEEFEDIMAINGFRSAGGHSLEAKQFGNSFDETLEFANKPFNKDKAAIVRVTIPKSIYDKLDHTMLDPHIFKSGTTTVGRDMMDIFNKSILEIKHVY